MAATNWNGLTADWSDPSQWTGGEPTAALDALIAAGGTYVVTISTADVEVANTVTLNAAGATLDLFGTLTTSSLVLTAGTVEIDGTLQNATVDLNGGSFTFGLSSTTSFNDVTWTGGALNFGTGSAEVLASNGLSAGTIDLEGSFSDLDITDTETLTGVTLNIGSATGEDVLAADGTLTLDAASTVNLLAGADDAELGGLGTLVNQGTINVAATDATINVGSLVNTGTIDITTTGFLELDTANLSGGGTLNVLGTLDGAYQSVTVGTSGAFANVTVDGTLENIGINLAGGSFTFGPSAVATFSNVGFTGGVLNFGTGSAEVLASNGLSAGTVDLEGSFSDLDITDTETLTGITLNIGSTTGDDALSADGTLTLDSASTVNLLAGADFAELGGLGTLINQGTINVASTDGVINVGSLVNTGAINVTTAGFLELDTSALSGGGTLTVLGTLDGAYQSITVGTSGAFANVSVDGTLQNIGINLAGGTFGFGQSAVATFSNVGFTGGVLNFGTGSAEVLASNGFSAGTVDLEGSFSDLDITDTETLTGVTLNIGSATGEDVLAADGTLTLDSASTVNLLAGADFAELGGLGTLINQGTINVASTDGVINVGSLVNTGAINVTTAGFLELDTSALSGGGTLTVLGTLDGAYQSITVGSSGAFANVSVDGTLQNIGINLAGGTFGFGQSAVATFSNVGFTGGVLNFGTGSAEVLASNGFSAGTVDLEGSFSDLDITDTETLTGITLNIGSTTGDDALSADGTLTLDSASTVNMLAGADFAELGGLGTLINQGTINVASTDGVINVGSLVNTGAINVTTAGFLELDTSALSGGGTLTVLGTLDGAYQSITVGSSGAFANVSVDGTLQNIGINLAGGTFGFGQSAVATFSNVGFTGGVLNFGTGSAEVLASNGFSAGTVDLEGSFSDLDITDTETLTGITLNIGSTTGDDALSADGTLTLDSASTVNFLANAGFTEISGLGSVINNGQINVFADPIINSEEFTNNGTLAVKSAGTLDVQPGDLFTNTGLISVASNSLLDIQYLSGFTNTGSLVVTGGTVDIGATLTGSGLISLANGSFVDIADGDGGGMISFGNAGDTLRLETTSFAGTLAGFAADGTLDIGSFAYVTGATAVASGTTLTVTDGTNVEQFTLASAPTVGTTFHVISDGQGGSDVTTMPCYRAGTEILTEHGPIAVEALQVGDVLVTEFDQHKPIKWIGQRVVDCAAHPRPETVWPIRVAAGAFGVARPCRDLYLSPDHAVFVDNALIPVRELVNGDTIRQIEVATVHYFHVELDQHDVILAENLPAESFLDSGNRAAFANGEGPVQLHPSFAAAAWDMACAPLLIHGPALDAIRQRLQARADDTVTLAA